MMKYFIIHSLIVVMLGISGCSFNNEVHEPLLSESSLNENQPMELSSQPNESQPIILPPEESRELVLNFHTHQMVSDFTERLAHDLMQDRKHTKWQGPIAVASFVNFDDTLQEANALGNLISENLLVEIQGYDVPVLDIHMKGWLNINPTGDYIFSRDGGEIVFNDNIKYVLSGVMIRVERGVKVNARIVELHSQKVMSTGSVLIPNFLIDSL